MKDCDKGYNPPKENCSSCKFFEYMAGVCRRFPPVLEQGHFPNVGQFKDETWCGEYKPHSPSGRKPHE